MIDSGSSSIIKLDELKVRAIFSKAKDYIIGLVFPARDDYRGLPKV